MLQEQLDGRRKQNGPWSYLMPHPKVDHRHKHKTKVIKLIEENIGYLCKLGVGKDPLKRTQKLLTIKKNDECVE